MKLPKRHFTCPICYGAWQVTGTPASMGAHFIHTAHKGGFYIVACPTRDKVDRHILRKVTDGAWDLR